MRKVLAGFAVVVGAAMAAVWLVLLTAGEVREIAEPGVEIWFHLAAELATAGLLVGGGLAWWRRDTSARRTLTAVGFGALLYAVIQAPGYYADLGEWAVAGVFGLLAALTVVAIGSMSRTAPVRRPRVGAEIDRRGHLTESLP